MAVGQLDIVDYYMQLERRVARLERTSSTANSQSDTTFVGLLDVTGLAVSSQTVVAYLADFQVYVNLGWNAVSLGSELITDDPLLGYYTSFTKDGTNYSAEAFTDTETAMIGPLAQGQTITFRVRAVTTKGTLGDYATVSFSTTLDASAPGQPSTPIATPYLGQVRVYWDGLDVSSSAMPSDLEACEIHISTSSISFTPTAATLVDVFYPGGGYYTITDLTYGTTYYVRLVAVDHVGNRSVTSTGASVVPVQAADGDIASLGIGKLIAGSLSADMTVSARIKTANTGARTEMNTAGFEAYNSGGIRTFFVDASTGNTTITGTFQTVTSGQRIVIDSGGNGTIYFYPSTGSDYSYINAPSSNSVGVNSGNGGTGNYTRLYALPDHVEMVYLTTAQAQAGGAVVCDSSGAWLSGLSGDLVEIFLDSSRKFYASTTDVVVSNANFSTSAVGSISLSSTSGNDITLDSTGDFIANSDGVISITSSTSDTCTFGKTGNVYLALQSDGHIILNNGGSTYLDITSTTINLNATALKSTAVVSSAFTANMYYNTSGGQIYYSTSSRAVKKDIRDASSDALIQGIMKIRPRTFYDKNQFEESGNNPELCDLQLGLVAEEVKEIEGLLGEVLYRPYADSEGNPLLPGVNYDRGWLALVPAIQLLLNDYNARQAA